MFFSDKEEAIMKSLFLDINMNGNEQYVLTFPNGDVLETVVDTCYETDNGLDEDDINFDEYHACAMKILRIIRNNSQTLQVGSILEINYHNYPMEIRNSKGKII